MTKKDAEDLGVQYVPMTYCINGVASQEDFVDLCDEYESQLNEKNSLRTSQANVRHSSCRLFISCAWQAHEVLCLAISSRLSGTYNNADQLLRARAWRGLDQGC
jgi:fatty acid-binding protein DegV